MTETGSTANAEGLEPIRLDIRTLKVRELRDIERAVGHKIASELATFDFGMDTIQGLLWIALRRQRPDATFDDAEELDFETIINGIEGPEAEPPPNPTPTPDSDGGKPMSSVGNDSTARPPSGEAASSSASSTA